MIIKPARLRNVFVKVQENILSIVTNKSLIGMATYKNKQILNRVQEQLDFMVNKSWEYAPDLFTRLYQYSKIDKHLRKLRLSFTDQTVVNRIVDNFMGHILETASFSYMMLNKLMQETRKEVLHQALADSVKDEAYKELYRQNIRKQGLVGFVDKAGKQWSMGNYTDMVMRTSMRMTNNHAVLFTYDKIDLYKIIGHANSCKKCAVHRNRVYSRSGTSLYYPPLASAFGKIDKNGLDNLENSYLNIHPNCHCSIVPFVEGGKTAKEIDKIREFSSYETNPPDKDPRSEAQVEAYKQRERGRQKLVDDFKEFQNMKVVLGGNMPKTFATFQKHKLSNSAQYKNWINSYKIS